jgi:hypothetical protein
MTTTCSAVYQPASWVGPRMRDRTPSPTLLSLPLLVLVLVLGLVLGLVLALVLVVPAPAPRRRLSKTLPPICMQDLPPGEILTTCTTPNPIKVGLTCTTCTTCTTCMC